MRRRRRLETWVAALAACAALQSAAALAQDGSLDTTFDDDGKVTVSWGDDAQATASAVAGGGRLLVAGEVMVSAGDDLWAVAELMEAGALAAPWTQEFEPFSFAAEGAYDAGTVLAVARIGDRTLVAGRVTGSMILPALARLEADASLDSTFSGNGLRVLQPPAAWDIATPEAAAILPNGGAVFVGLCTDCTTSGEQASWVARTLPSGAPDPSFSGDGWLAFEVNGLETASAKAVALADDGTVRLTGAGLTPGGSAWRTYLARVTSAGNLDSTFGGGDGIAPLVDLGPARLPTSLAFDPSSSRTYAGVADTTGFTSGAVVAFDAAGVLEVDFSGTGIHEIDLEEGSSVLAIAVQSDGRILLAGPIDANDEPIAGFLLARLTSGGARDSTFHGNGVIRVEFDIEPNGADTPFDATLWGGRLAVVGVARDSGGDNRFAVVRTRSRLIFRDGFERATAGGWGQN